MNCEPKNERYMPHKIETPPVAVKALGDNELADWVKIIEYLVAGDRARAIDYALHLIGICEDKFKRTGDIFDKYDIMTARNILHTLKGEPKEGGVAVLD